MAVKYTVPARPPRPAQEICVPYLTDAEIQGLSYAFLDKNPELGAYENMAGNPKYQDGRVISGWTDVTPRDTAEWNARFREAMLSLERLGLVVSHQVNDTLPMRDRAERVDEDGILWVRPSYSRYKLTDEGLKIHYGNRARIYVCCEACVRLPCVCRERTFCAEHRGGCHGPHD